MSESSNKRMDKRLFFLLNMGQHKLYKHVDQRCEQSLGTPVAQVAALLYLSKSDGCLLKELSNALNLNNSAMTGLSNRLVNNKLVERRPCELDGRASRLFINDKGRDVVTGAFPLLNEMNELLSEEFTQAELEVVARFLNRLIERF